MSMAGLEKLWVNKSKSGRQPPPFPSSATRDSLIPPPPSTTPHTYTFFTLPNLDSSPPLPHVSYPLLPSLPYPKPLPRTIYSPSIYTTLTPYPAPFNLFFLPYPQPHTPHPSFSFSYPTPNPIPFILLLPALPQPHTLPTTPYSSPPLPMCPLAPISLPYRQPVNMVLTVNRNSKAY